MPRQPGRNAAVPKRDDRTPTPSPDGHPGPPGPPGKPGDPARATLSFVARSGAYLFGRLAGRQFRKAKWMWDSVAGAEDDAIRAQQGLGREMAAAVREQAPGPVDASVQALLDELAAALADRVRNPIHRFEVTAVAGERPTAFALPGGYIFVAPALVDLAGRNRDELAFTIGHEMAHVIRGHAIDRIKLEWSQKALSAVSVATPAGRAVAPWLRSVGVQWLEKAYSREQEFEADELGGRLMRAAGFDPHGCVRMLERFRRLEGESDPLGLAGYLSTHPPVDDRIHHLRERLELGTGRR